MFIVFSHNQFKRKKDFPNVKDLKHINHWIFILFFYYERKAYSLKTNHKNHGTLHQKLMM